MPFEIYREIKSPAIRKKNIEKILQQAWPALNLSPLAEISIALVNDRTIRRLNKKYRRKDKVTDVLSFSEKDSGPFIVPQERRYLGEIVISYKRVYKQAQLNKHSVQKEFDTLLVHGLLHLLGYDHTTGKSEKIMRDLENKISTVSLSRRKRRRK